ncbi:50S ribosomal protein L6 [Candidatus Woesearchaeota archaeon]|nr:50S ribosomal protein L6 [Candidatus Woesearchaeota archaeon]
MRKDLKRELEIPENCKVDIDFKLKRYIVSVQGPLGIVTRHFKLPNISLKVQDNKVVVQAINACKKEKKLVNTTVAHFKNLFKGVTQGHVYKLKICSSHFPMNVSVKGNVLEIKNFLGEKHPRRYVFSDKVKLSVKDNDIIVEGFDKELVGQTAADIEKLTRRTGFDRRIFQDGIYIYYKDGKTIA